MDQERDIRGSILTLPPSLALLPLHPPGGQQIMKTIYQARALQGLTAFSAALAAALFARGDTRRTSTRLLRLPARLSALCGRPRPP